MNKNKNVSVVVPNYNGKNLLKKFLPSIFTALNNGDELIIVDDYSSDKSISWLIKEFKLELVPSGKRIRNAIKDLNYPPKYNPNVNKLEFKLYSKKIAIKSAGNNSLVNDISNEDLVVNNIRDDNMEDKIANNKKEISILLISQLVNLRFAATANFGVLMAKNNLVFLINNDVKLTQDVIKQLRTNFQDQKVFAAGCLEYEKNKLGSKSGKNKLWFSKGTFVHSKADNFRSGKTAWVSGGSGMFSRKKWLHLNGFDKIFYPAYWEDVDLSFRARQNGWKVLFDENAVVYHVHESTNMDEFGIKKIEAMSWKNAQAFVLKNANWWQKICYYLFKSYWNYKRS